MIILLCLMNFDEELIMKNENDLCDIFCQLDGQ